jgi:hypothetical protein
MVGTADSELDSLPHPDNALQHHSAGDDRIHIRIGGNVGDDVIVIGHGDSPKLVRGSLGPSRFHDHDVEILKICLQPGYGIEPDIHLNFSDN